MNASIEIQNGVKTLSGAPADAKYYNNSGAPYTSIDEVVAQIPQSLRGQGLTINILGIEYWWNTENLTINPVVKIIPSNPEIYIGSDQPANTFKLWIDTSVDDVDILRAIRDANPQSTQLAALFDDTKDPHTEWWDDVNLQGVLFGDSPLLSSEVSINNAVLPDILNPNKVYFLRLRFGLNPLDISGLTDLFYLNVGGGLTSIDISPFTNVQCLGLYYNALTSESIESILHNLVLFNNPNINRGNFLDLTGGTNAGSWTWTEQAVIDYNTLISRGWIINSNSPS